LPVAYSPITVPSLDDFDSVIHTPIAVKGFIPFGGRGYRLDDK
jgi:hypothetical protein